MKYYELGGESVRLKIEHYQNGNTAIQAYCKDGDPFACLTVNLGKLDSKEYTYLNVNLWGFNVEKFFNDNKLGEKVEGKTKQSGFVTYPLYKLNLKKIQEGL